MDTVVFDIETQNFFTDPGVGRDNFAALKISVVGAYSYARDTYVCFAENEMAAVAELFAQSGRIVGFSSNRYDVPVLNRYLQRETGGRLNLWHKDRVDILEDIELATGMRISLSRLAEANLGVTKDRHGSEAITLYHEGRMDELKAYCLNDVKITKELYDLYRSQGYLLVPNRDSGITERVELRAPMQTTRLL
ncbi:MAG: hypothetical protein RL681_607 [Candidatus Parcubacteria bacterium]|jgi:DEAD/DEAH box helicase domain-containing protein